MPSEIIHVLDKAGNNSAELEKVINFYSKRQSDSLKLKAAIFLIKNLEGRYYYEGEVLDQYSQYSKLIRNDKTSGIYIMRMLDSIYGTFYYEDLDKKYDLENVKSEALIENIELSFKTWKESPWNKDVTFNNFCEYLLPYKVSNEKPEFLRKRFYEKYKRLLDSARAEGDVFRAVEILNKELLREQDWLPSSRQGFLPHFPVSEIMKYRVGTCREMCDLGTQVMRAQGIPVAIDFVYQWPDAQGGHNWNRVMVPSGKTITYLGAREGPDTINRRPLMAKVYRFTYSPNPESLAMLRGKYAQLPSLFKNTRIKDVTNEYATVHDVSIQLSRPIADDSVAYLGVFDNAKWVPVNWSFTKGQKALFKDNQGGVAYLPCYYNNVRGTIAASYPFLLQEDGEVHSLKPNTADRHAKMTLTHIFPMYPPFYKTKRMIGGVFQGANKADFSDAETLYRIVAEPLVEWNTVPVKPGKAFRYVRYLSSPDQYTSIAELKIINGQGELNGTPIGTPGSRNNHPRHTFEKALDGDIRTYYESRFASGGWVGYDFGKPENFDAIQFSPMYSGEKWTHIVTGNEYELHYWKDNEGWASLGKEIGKDGEVTFRNVPSNALYILKSNSRVIRERIFTYENGKVVWR